MRFMLEGVCCCKGTRCKATGTLCAIYWTAQPGRTGATDGRAFTAQKSIICPAGTLRSNEASCLRAEVFKKGKNVVL